MLAEAERERRQGRAGNPAERGQGWMARAKARTMRWVAESIAEQRLLWHLRGQTDACLFYPDDIEEARANTVLRSQLQTDFEKHRFWLIINSPRVRRLRGVFLRARTERRRLLLRLPPRRSLFSRCAARVRDCRW